MPQPRDICKHNLATTQAQTRVATATKLVQRCIPQPRTFATQAPANVHGLLLQPNTRKDAYDSYMTLKYVTNHKQPATKYASLQTTALAAHAAANDTPHQDKRSSLLQPM